MGHAGSAASREPFSQPIADEVEIEIKPMEKANGYNKTPDGPGETLTVEVKHAIRGRLRIAVRFPAENPEGPDQLHCFLQSRDGVSGVMVCRRSSQYTIHYNAEQITKTAIIGAVSDLTAESLKRLAETLKNAEADDKSLGEVKEIKAPERVFPKFLESDERLTASPLPYIVRHSMPGRLRLSIPLLTVCRGLADGLDVHLSSRPGIISTSSLPRCGSVTVLYDTDTTTKAEVLQALDELTVGTLIAVTRELPARVVEDHEISKSFLRLTTVSVVASFAFAGVPFVALATVYPILIFVTLPVYRRAYRCLKDERRLNVDFLDAAALTAAMLTGDVINASAMAWLIHLGDHIRDLTASSSHRTIRKLLDFQDNYAWVVRGDAEVKIKVKDIVEGDVVALNVGKLIPVDGEVIEGELIVDQQVLTGESLPVHKEVGDTVLASTVIKDGKAYVRAVRTGNNTKVAQVVKMVEEAPIYETKIQNHAEKMADKIVLPSLITTCAIFAVSMSPAHLAAMLTVDFGTGIRVSAPTAVLSSMIAAVSHGILIKGGTYLEKLANVDTIVFDKTGTLTTGVIRVEDTFAFHGFSDTDVLSFAATAELQMTHPIAEAVVDHAAELDIPVRPREDSRYWVGRGVEAFVEGRRILVGSKRLLVENGVVVHPDEEEITEKSIAQGKACLYVAADEQLCGIITFRDQIRPEAKSMIEELHKVGVKQVIMLTGDVKKLAYPVAKSLGIDRCIAEVLPEQKAEVIIDLKKNGHVVAFVGDGINDSVGLSYADIGISVHGGADITKETAGVILLDEDLHKIPKAFEISRQTIRLIKESYTITGTFNVFAYALAALGLVSPVMSTLISNGSAVVACVNGMKPVIKLKLKELGAPRYKNATLAENAALPPSEQKQDAAAV